LENIPAKLDQLYAGKAKSVFKTENSDYLILEFRDDTSAFDGKRIEQLERKGRVNNQFNAFIMSRLAEAGIETHFEKSISATESVVKCMRMIPLECVVRNRAAGSLCKRLGVEEGIELSPPTFELFLKNDALGDPMVNESHAQTFGWATQGQIDEMRTITFRVNQVLKKLFDDGGMILVDYKLEFGLFDNRVVLGDEFSPDGCRLWDKQTNEKLDKDRFRQGLGNVVESYEAVGHRLGIEFV
jgi:phosphoribosylaminoimidazole-succinocarboxamide synthase